ncbi:MAG: hypothetical protein V7724_16175 [Sediminicola sp.]|tara:strand:+ start:33795 stop:34331 length:537 start_codon:yes stop_codon:yes gene_type:complete
MFLKGIKEKFKHKSGRRHLQQELKKPLKGIDRKKGISAVACIVNLDQFSDTDAFYGLANEYGLQPNAIKIIGYKELYDKNSPYSTPVFSDRDLGWGGKIENGYVLEFLNREYDILINYYTEDKLLLKLMTLKTRARLYVGFGEVDKNLNDLILNMPIADFKLFSKELGKYLKVLKEIG